MKTLLFSLLPVLLLAAAPLRAEEEKPAATPAGEDVAIVQTTAGEMVIAFWPKEAPKTVANFETLARKGFYNGTIFHRIVKGFMIQGGDPLSKDPAKSDSWGTGGPGYRVPAEFNDHAHVPGVLSMARSSDPDSAGSQFFICLGTPSMLDHQYTAFGHVIKGMDVLQKIGDTPVTISPGGEMSRPTEKVEIKSIKIVPASAVK